MKKKEAEDQALNSFNHGFDALASFGGQPAGDDNQANGPDQPAL